MRGRGQHGVRPALNPFGVLLVEIRDGRSKARGISADLVERYETIVHVEDSVFDGFGHDRTRQLLELHDKFNELGPVLRTEIRHVPQQQRVAHEIEQGLRRARVALPGFRYSNLDVGPVPLWNPFGPGDVSAVDRKGGNDLAQSKGETVQREIPVPAVLFGEAVELLAQEV